MINNNPSSVDEIAHQYSMKWESAFRELMDQIYFEGYSQQLAEEKPNEYQIEYLYFISLYDSPIYDDTIL